jgi:CzcA family heavy metal efflux pump
MKNIYTTYKGPLATLIIIILATGIYSYRNIQNSLFPEITFPKIKIIAENGEQPVDKMAVTVTVPLENAIKQTQNLKMLRSTTSRGSAEFSAFLDWGTDVDLGMQRIESLINEIKGDLPPETRITVRKMNPAILPIMGYSLESDSRSQIELKQIAEYTIKPILSAINGISEVTVMGGKTKEYQVFLDPVRMSESGITPQIVNDVVSQKNFIVSNGFVKDYNRLYLNLTDVSILNLDELKNTVIKNTDKRKITLNDIADISIGEKREYVKIKANGKDVPLIGIVRQPFANLLQVESDVRQQITSLEKSLPKDIKLIPFYDQADFVNDSLKSIKDVLWLGLFLALLINILFLRSIKASAVVLLTIPVTLSLTILILYLLNYTLNIMTIGAIAAAIGLIIDDAIVVVEQIHRTHEENPEESSFSLVGKAINYLFPAMVGSSLSTIVIFFPFVLMSGVAGAYFKVLTNTMILTLVCSFFSTWLALPVLYVLLSKKKFKVSLKSKDVKRQKWVNFFITKPYIAIILSVVLIAASLYIITKLESGFLPEMDEGSIVLDFKSPAGTTLEETDRMLQKVDKILEETPEVDTYSRRIGTQLGFFITEPNNGDYLIKLKKSRKKSTEDVIDDIRTGIGESLPYLQVDFGQVIGDMLGDLMSSVQPIEIKIFGDDIEKLKNLAEKVTNIIENTPGTADAFNGITIAGPEIIVKPDEGSLARFNMTPKDLQYQIQTKIGGSIIGQILERNRQVDIRMYEAGNRNEQESFNSLLNSNIFLPDGKLKPANELASINLIKGVSENERENLKPVVIVTARLNNRDLGSTLTELKSKIGKSVSLPEGYRVEYGGAYSEQQSAFSELLFILFLAVCLVFVVILFIFRNIRVALVIIFISLIGISGSIIALYVTGTPLNVGSYTGLIMIVGIIGENAIFTYLQYRENRKINDRDSSLIFSISTRLRPKLMTAISAIVALFPLALGQGAGAQMHQPLAISIIGGLVVALPLLLIVLPSYLRMVEK